MKTINVPEIKTNEDAKTIGGGLCDAFSEAEFKDSLVTLCTLAVTNDTHLSATKAVSDYLTSGDTLEISDMAAIAYLVATAADSLYQQYQAGEDAEVQAQDGNGTIH